MTLRHAVTQLETKIKVPVDACIRDVKKIVVRHIALRNHIPYTYKAHRGL